MGTIRRRGQRIYGIWIDETGKRVERALKVRTVSEARLLVQDLEKRAERIRLGLSDGDTSLTIQGAWEQYAKIAQQKRSWRSLEGRFRLHILPALGAHRMQSMRPADIEAFLAERASTGLSPQTVEHLRVHLAALFTFAKVKLRALSGDNPARLADAPEIPERPPRYLEAHQVRAILEEVEPRWRNLFALAVYTGMRKGELLGLRRQDVDLERRIITVGRSYEGTTKANRVRWVPIPPELEPFLAAQLRADDTEHLFTDKWGKALNRNFDATHRLKTALKKAGLVRGYKLVCRRRGCGFAEESKSGEPRPCPRCDFKLWPKAIPLDLSFKDLRSTHATLAYEATGDIRYVQRVLGHSDPRITERVYAGMRPEQLVAQSGRVSLSRASTPHPQKSAETSRIHTNGDEEP